MEAIEAGAANMTRHLGIIREFGLNAVVAVNAFPGDTTDEVELVKRIALEHGAYAAEANNGFLRGGEGGAALAEAVVAAADEPSKFDFVYPLDAPIEDKIELIAKRVYGADGINLLPAARAKIKSFNETGLDKLPICMAKTQLSLSHDPALRGRPKGFRFPIRDVRLSAGAGFLVPLAGTMMTMPGLPKNPGLLRMDLDAGGLPQGLF
jgi:formyltetrahydrofolate synthetase